MAQPAFSDHPPEHQQTPVIRLRRVGAQPVTAVCTSVKPVGVQVHYHQGRTIPHYDHDPCGPCEDGNAPRWKGYLTLFDAKSGTHWLQEYTPAAHDGISDALTHFGSLRGHLIRFERIRPTKNAPMRSEVYLSLVPETELPPEPDIIVLLYRIWQLTPETTQAALAASRSLTHYTATRPSANNREPKTPLAPPQKQR